MTKHSKKTNGFGIIEVLIASVIIIIGASSFTFVSQNTLNSTRRTQERTQAANLAAEGIEIVRQIRDTNWIDQNAATGWGTWFNSSGTAGGWAAVTAGNSYRPSFNTTLNRFYLIDAGGTPETVTLDNSAYTRIIYIDSIGNLLPDQLYHNTSYVNLAYKVRVVVTTPSGAPITVSEVLTNWRPNF